MAPYMKRFVLASLFYLGLSVIFGILNGTTEIGYFGYFAHTHFNMLGFMSMMVFGIAYFILPRFNGTSLRFPGWIAPHFWLANFSLVGMVLFRGWDVQTGSEVSHILFIISASIQALTIAMFITNIWLTLSPQVQSAQSTAVTPPTEKASRPMPAPAAESVHISLESPIAELVDRLPSIQDILVRGGLGALAMPGHIDKVRMMGITLGQAASNHGLETDPLLNQIRDEFEKCGITVETATNSGEDKGTEITPDMLIGDIMQMQPQSKAVFEQYFGSGCFDCPGQSYESIDLACRMHGVDPEEFIEQLTKAVST